MTYHRLYPLSWVLGPRKVRIWLLLVLSHSDRSLDRVRVVSLDSARFLFRLSSMLSVVASRCHLAPVHQVSPVETTSGLNNPRSSVAHKIYNRAIQSRRSIWWMNQLSQVVEKYASNNVRFRASWKMQGVNANDVERWERTPHRFQIA